MPDFSTRRAGQQSRMNLFEDAGDTSRLNRMAPRVSAPQRAGIGRQASMRDIAQKNNLFSRTGQARQIDQSIRAQEQNQAIQNDENIRAQARLALNQRGMNFSQGMQTRQFDEGVRRFDAGRQDNAASRAEALRRFNISRGDRLESERVGRVDRLLKDFTPDSVTGELGPIARRNAIFQDQADRRDARSQSLQEKRDARSQNLRDRRDDGRESVQQRQPFVQGQRQGSYQTRPADGTEAATQQRQSQAEAFSRTADDIGRKILDVDSKISVAETGGGGNVQELRKQREQLVGQLRDNDAKKDKFFRSEKKRLPSDVRNNRTPRLDLGRVNRGVAPGAIGNKSIPRRDFTDLAGKSARVINKNNVMGVKVDGQFITEAELKDVYGDDFTLDKVGSKLPSSDNFTDEYWGILDEAKSRVPLSPEREEEMTRDALELFDTMGDQPGEQANRPGAARGRTGLVRRPTARGSNKPVDVSKQYQLYANEAIRGGIDKSQLYDEEGNETPQGLAYNQYISSNLNADMNPAQAVQAAAQRANLLSPEQMVDQRLKEIRQRKIDIAGYSDAPKFARDEPDGYHELHKEEEQILQARKNQRMGLAPKEDEKFDINTSFKNDRGEDDPSGRDEYINLVIDLMTNPKDDKEAVRGHEEFNRWTSNKEANAKALHKLYVSKTKKPMFNKASNFIKKRYLKNVREKLGANKNVDFKILSKQYEKQYGPGSFDEDFAEYAAKNWSEAFNKILNPIKVDIKKYDNSRNPGASKIRKMIKDR